MLDLSLQLDCWQPCSCGVHMGPLHLWLQLGWRLLAQLAWLSQGCSSHALPCLQDRPSSHQVWDSDEGPSASKAGQTMHHAQGGACVAENMGGIVGRSTP